MTSERRTVLFSTLRVVLASWLMAMLVGTAVAGPFEDAVSAYDRGDYATAIRLLRPLAERGDAEAQNNLGVMYDNGRGVPRDDTEAAKWFRKAADQGIADAQYNIGVMYFNGREVLRRNMPITSLLNEKTFARIVVGLPLENMFLEYQLESSTLKDGQNQIAVEIHQIGKNSSDISFAMQLDEVSWSPAGFVGVQNGVTLKARTLAGKEWSPLLETAVMIR